MVAVDEVGVATDAEGLQLVSDARPDLPDQCEVMPLVRPPQDLFPYRARAHPAAAEARLGTVMADLAYLVDQTVHLGEVSGLQLNLDGAGCRPP